ncbi:hypothetical protein JVU11DRAFT_11691 [Chiua virens]|nr:hypothetical protein JVU11DRAFT_11691 [Chiua virens]
MIISYRVPKLNSMLGSAAAWLQRYFWGAAVKSGSWFAWLQAAGMGAVPIWANVVAKMHLLIGGLFAMLFRTKQD